MVKGGCDVCHYLVKGGHEVCSHMVKGGFAMHDTICDSLWEKGALHAKIEIEI